MNVPLQEPPGRLATRHRIGWCFEKLCLGSSWTGIAALGVMLVCIAWMAWGWLDWKFLTVYDSRRPEDAGILAGLWGSFWVITITTLVSVPVGVGAAVYLEEYSRDSWLRRLIQTNLSNLAGVPSIVYGILGLTVFVQMFGLFGSPGRGTASELNISLLVTTLKIPLPFGPTVISGALTLSLLILPVVIVASQEALRAVPSSVRHASLALGATRWQTIRHQVLPSSVPGILTGVILSLSRAIGETAPLIMIGAVSFVAFTPGEISSPAELITNPGGIAQAPFDRFTALPIQIYNWISLQAKSEFKSVAAAGILVLLAVLSVLNGIAVTVRHRYQKRTRW